MDIDERLRGLFQKPPASQAGALLLVALFVAFYAACPLIGEPGFLNTRGGGDSPFLLQRLQQLETALRDGHFPVRWMPDAYYGYGYPFFNFYAPLSIYIAALFRFLGFSLVRSIELAQLAGFLSAAWGMYLLARRLLGSKWAAFLASISYTVAPFHLVNIYVRGDSLAEFWAMAFYPWIILAADQIFRSKEDSNHPYGAVAGLALAYGALILSHNISALIFTPFLLLFLVIRPLLPESQPAHAREDVSSKKRKDNLLWGAAALILAWGLSAWFFLPALVEQNLAQLTPVTAGYFHYSNHFRGTDLVQLSLLFDYSVDGGNAFRMGLVQAAAAFAGVLALAFMTWKKRSVNPLVTVYILFSFLVATFMVTPLSRILWDTLPLLPFTQFPWRFLSVQAFFAALSTGAVAFLGNRRFLVAGIAAFLIASAFLGLNTDNLIINDQDVTAERLAWYEWFTGNVGSTVSAEYLPPYVQPRTYSSSWLVEGREVQAQVLKGDLITARLIEKDTTRQEWMITAAENGATLLFPTLMWPGWTAEVNQQEVQIAPASGSGLITLDLGTGENRVTLRLTRTPIRLAAELLSLGALVVLVFLLVRSKWRPRRRPSFSIFAVLLILFLLLFRFWPQKMGSAQDLTWDFARMGYLHHDIAGVPFDNGMVMEGYDYDRQSAQPGEDFNITLILSGTAEQEVTVSLATPATAWPIFEPRPPVFASETKRVSGETARFQFTLPSNIPQGMVIPKVTVREAKPLTEGGKKRGEIFLRPFRVGNMSPQVADHVGLDVQALDVIQRHDQAVDVQLAWQTDRRLSQNYNASLRLIDGSGNWVAQMDAQPGYGFIPSSTWPKDTVINDWLALPLPDDISEDGLFTLVANLYDIASGETVLTRRLGQVRIDDNQLSFQEHAARFSLPSQLMAASGIFGDSIKLEGYQLQESSTSLDLTLYWRAISDGGEDYTRFVHLIDPQSGEILAQVDSLPQYNSYPTSQWLLDEIVSDRIVIPLEQGLPAEYEIGVGFYRWEGGNLLRLTAQNEETEISYPDDRLPLLRP